jgi:hypothetical protein
MAKFIRRRHYEIEVQMTNYTPVKIRRFRGKFIKSQQEENDMIHIFRLDNGQRCRVGEKYMTLSNEIN